jgi:hypothetical protein
MAETFKKKVEDFDCEHCGHNMVGDGYTNHCEKCLWSKHVDIFPGDRAETCGGLLEPAGVLKKGEDYIITHRCVRCKVEKNITARANDNFEALLALC